MDWPVIYARKIRFSDTDAQKIVFNGNYLTYWDDAITDYFDALGIPAAEFAEQGYEIVLGRVEIDFRASAGLGDVASTGVRVARIGTTSVQFDARTWDEEDVTVVEGKLIQVVVDHATFRPRPVPDFFRQAVERLQGPLPG